MRTPLAIGALLIPGSALAQAPTTPPPLYALEYEVKLPSTADWDYMKVDPVNNRLFIARRRDGLTVFDLKTRKHITLSNSIGANGPLLLPEYDRGYVAMTDGTLLSFELKSLKVLDRIRLDAAGLNGAVYDPAAKMVQVITDSRPVETTFYTIDPRTGKLVGQKSFPFRKMDDPTPDGKGFLYASTRRNAVILKLDSRTLEEKGRWQVKGCEQTVKTVYHAASDRVLVGCRGEKPVFTAFNATSGAQLDTIPIGQNIDGMGVDEKRKRIVVATGGSGTLGVIEMRGPDDYKLLGHVGTRAGARIMALDQRDGRVYTITAGHTVGPQPPTGVPPVTYLPNSFVVMSYKPID
ncbi:hypothetical protein M9978_11505 [Sphingomonas sp. MG17]|uniref:Uncharacterized protein n=1 Tax=Sphingomonas tagetis TaxID=2949092 RepID=A0A9X2HKW4_9SPHN|nr:hypothetical protein [Sphingomonas tagetis]MCP3731054.1 hypothetical protein [Sphingomonas tagetis]